MKDPRSNENPAETYLVIEDISGYTDSTITYVVSLTDLQRNLANPLHCPRKAVSISELEVVADDINSFVNSWNEIAQ